MTVNKEKEMINNLNKVGFDSFSILFFVNSIKICKSKKIHIIDLNLTRHIYPELSEKFEKTKGSLESKMIDNLINMWNNKENRKMFKKIYKYNKKPTIGKMIKLLLLQN